MSIIIWQGHTKRTIRLIFTGMSSIFIEDTQIPQVGFAPLRPVKGVGDCRSLAARFERIWQDIQKGI